MRRGVFNGSKEGYDKGFGDGLAGRPKKAVDSVRETFAHAIRPKSYTETFLRAYGKGYDDGNRKRNQVKAEEYRKDWKPRYRPSTPERISGLEAAQKDAKAKERQDGKGRGG